MLDFTKPLLFDGGMGTMLQKENLPAGVPPEKWNLTAPEKIRKVHAAYASAGADIITANTFGASRKKLGEDPAPCIAAGIALARQAAGGRMVALDVGPLGVLLEPFGEMTFDEAYRQFAEIMEAGEQAGADLVLIETMSDLLEAKAALLAAREHTALPAFVTMTFSGDGKTFLGVDPAAAAVTLTALGADVVGINCSLGPRELQPALETMLEATCLPVIVQPNAGLPRMEGGETVYDVGVEEFAAWGRKFLDMGVSVLGGCCGTTPEHIRALRGIVDTAAPVPKRWRGGRCRLCGWQGVRTLDMDSVAVVGERLNPTGRPQMKAALYAGDWDGAAEAAVAQEREGADFLVVNVGLPDIDEEEALPALVLAIQKVSPLPLVIDCSVPAAMEKALRVCRGRPILNSVNGGAESLAAMLPLAVKYGTGLIVLALDENGIGSEAAARRDVALRAARAAQAAGVRREDILIDCLAMTASISQNELLAAPEAIRMVRQAGYKTLLGVSNVSHGLPGRDALNCAFLAVCVAAGLNVPIVNTGSPGVWDTLAAAKVLAGADPGCGAFIARYQGEGIPAPQGEAKTPEAALAERILSGQKSGVPAAAEALLEQWPPLQVINDCLIPALDRVGALYEEGKLFLPQLMASAEAVKAAFASVRRRLPPGAREKGTILLATVKDDVHDIGKNIVGMLLENYGYHVIDLGRDVAPEAVVRAALETGAPLVGLSSLMTTTARNIAVTVRALRDSGAPCKIMVGGAVVTQAFADQIGADYYAKDAAQSARVAAQVFGQ